MIIISNSESQKGLRPGEYKGLEIIKSYVQRTNNLCVILRSPELLMYQVSPLLPLVSGSFFFF